LLIKKYSRWEVGGDCHIAFDDKLKSREKKHYVCPTLVALKDDKTSIFIVLFGLLSDSNMKSALDHTNPFETRFKHPLDPFNSKEPTRTFTGCPVRTDWTG